MSHGMPKNKADASLYLSSLDQIQANHHFERHRLFRFNPQAAVERLNRKPAALHFPAEASINPSAKLRY